MGTRTRDDTPRIEDVPTEKMLRHSDIEILVRVVEDLSQIKNDHVLMQRSLDANGKAIAEGNAEHRVTATATATALSQQSTYLQNLVAYAKKDDDRKEAKLTQEENAREEEANEKKRASARAAGLVKTLTSRETVFAIFSVVSTIAALLSGGYVVGSAQGDTSTVQVDVAPAPVAPSEGAP